MNIVVTYLLAHTAWEKYIKWTQSNDTNTSFRFYFYVPSWRILPFLQELPQSVLTSKKNSLKRVKKKHNGIRKTLNLSTDADSITIGMKRKENLMGKFFFRSQICFWGVQKFLLMVFLFVLHPSLFVRCFSIFWSPWSPRISNVQPTSLLPSFQPSNHFDQKNCALDILRYGLGPNKFIFHVCIEEKVYKHILF